jgi:DNA-binding CsgD family transcriptional regulator
MAQQGDLRAPDYLLTNTGKSESSLAMGVTYHQPAYTLTMYYSNFRQKLGILRGSVSGNLDDLEEALEELAQLDRRKSQVVELRYFGGLSLEETAEVLGISLMTVRRDWRAAKAWLYRRIKHDA